MLRPQQLACVMWCGRDRKGDKSIRINAEASTDGVWWLRHESRLTTGCKTLGIEGVFNPSIVLHVLELSRHHIWQQASLTSASFPPQHNKRIAGRFPPIRTNLPTSTLQLLVYLCAMNEQQEVLEFQDSDRIESQALIPPDRGNGNDEPFPTPGSDISSLSDREIWRHFESTKKSAIYHLGRYFQSRKAWQQLQPANASLSLDLGT